MKGRLLALLVPLMVAWMGGSVGCQDTPTPKTTTPLIVPARSGLERRALQLDGQPVTLTAGLSDAAPSSWLAAWSRQAACGTCGAQLSWSGWQVIAALGSTADWRRGVLESLQTDTLGPHLWLLTGMVRPAGEGSNVLELRAAEGFKPRTWLRGSPAERSELLPDLPLPPGRRVFSLQDPGGGTSPMIALEVWRFDRSREELARLLSLPPGSTDEPSWSAPFPIRGRPGHVTLQASDRGSLLVLALLPEP